MSIRLIRVSKELNVGISSLVEFLGKKGVQVEANPNVKIENEHYEMLIVEFGKDKNIKKTVEQNREKQLDKDKKQTVAIEGYDILDNKQKQSEEKEIATASNLSNDVKPHFKIVGNIDLDSLKAKPKKKVEHKDVDVNQEIVNSEPLAPDYKKEKKAEPIEKIEKFEDLTLPKEVKSEEARKQN